MANAAPVVVEGTTGNVLAVNSDGSINMSGFSGNITGNITVSDVAHANAAAPTYTEATDQPLSADLKGNQRVRALIDGTSIILSAETCTPKFATIVASSSGATTVVAAVGGKKIRVLGYVVTGSGTVNVKFQSHVTPTDLTGLLYMNATEFGTVSFNPYGWFETVSGEALDINLSSNTSVGGHLVYIEV
jgi:hypothetical protein